ncbi:sucrose transport protein SUC8-like [Arachis stenosperma]|uniref:sucrose transport protein SUC8-like n=1 Tax=Arachis stenosperma TaxID=217475 RepID=UPI0025AC303E|nr:sucrose transport protein SUC8-like [Arachis stenosperma]
MTVCLSKLAKDERLHIHDLFDTHPASTVIQILAHCVFGILGIFLAIAVIVVPALASIYSNKSGAGKGFATDIDYAFGDDLSKKILPRAIVIFTIGFWLLDASIVLTKASCQAFLIVLASRDERKITLTNTFSTFFMAVENLMGFFSVFVHTFPFPATKACHSDDYCIWVKSVLFSAILLLLSLKTMVLYFIWDKPSLLEEETHEGEEKDD